MALVGLMGSPVAVAEAGGVGQTGNTFSCKTAVKSTKSVQVIVNEVRPMGIDPMTTKG